MTTPVGLSTLIPLVIGAVALAALVDVSLAARRRRQARPLQPSMRRTMPIDTHVRVAAILHIVLASIALLVLFVIGAMIGAFGAFGESMGVERDVAAWVGGVGMIVIALLAVIVITQIVGAVLLLRGSDVGRIITLVFSGLSLLNIPFGTAVGIYSLWALLREVPKPAPAPGRTEPAQSF